MTSLAKQLVRLCWGNRQRVEILAEKLLAAERPRQTATTVDYFEGAPTACPPAQPANPAPGLPWWGIGGDRRVSGA